MPLVIPVNNLPKPWSATKGYVADDVVTEWSGMWRALVANTNSKPDSGNVNWELISDTFTKVIDLTPTQLREQSGNPPTFLAAPGSGKLLQLVGPTVLVANQTSIPFVAGSLNIAYAGTSLNLLDEGLQSYFDAGGDDDLQVSGINPAYSANLSTAGTNKALVWRGGTDDESGAVLTSSIGDGGLGYAPLDTFGFGPAGGPTGVIDTVGALGVVTAYHLTSNGFGVEATPGQATFTSGAGTGLTIDVNSITPANGTARVWITAKILSLP